jgi:hypothetical protein
MGISSWCSARFSDNSLRNPSIDPLDGTIADYQAGRRRGEWTAVEITTRALERCRAEGILIGVLGVLRS